METFPGCLDVLTDATYDSNIDLTKFVADARILNCAHKLLMYEKKKQEIKGMNMALKQSVLQSNNSHINQAQKNMNDKQFYYLYPVNLRNLTNKIVSL